MQRRSRGHIAVGSTDEVTAIQASLLPATQRVGGSHESRNGYWCPTPPSRLIEGFAACPLRAIHATPPSPHVRFAPRADIRPMPALVSGRPSFQGIGSQPISENIAIGSSFDVASEAVFEFRPVEGRLLALLLRLSARLRSEH